MYEHLFKDLHIQNLLRHTLKIAGDKHSTQYQEVCRKIKAEEENIVKDIRKMVTPVKNGLFIDTRIYFDVLHPVVQNTLIQQYKKSAHNIPLVKTEDRYFSHRLGEIESVHVSSEVLADFTKEHQYTLKEEAVRVYNEVIGKFSKSDEIEVQHFEIGKVDNGAIIYLFDKRNDPLLLHFDQAKLSNFVNALLHTCEWRVS